MRTPGSRARSLASRSRAQRKAASVLPEPVGAETSTCCPEAMASHAPVWAAVGAAKAEPNHAATAGEKRASAGWTSDGTRTEEHAVHPHASRVPGSIGRSCRSPATGGGEGPWPGRYDAPGGPMPTQLDHIILSVNDPAPTIDFYPSV